MAIRVNWDEYETALLIDTFWKIEENPSQKHNLIETLSSNLRKMAITNGLEIDEKYRNINGISMQLSPIAHAFFPERPTLTSSAMFDKMVEIYKTDRNTFDSYVKSAMVKINSSFDASAIQPKYLSFEEWLDTNSSKKYSSSFLISSLKDADAYLLNHNLAKKSIFNNENAKEVSSLLSKVINSRIFRLTHKNTFRVLNVAVPLYKKYLAYKANETSNCESVVKETPTTTCNIEKSETSSNGIALNTIDYARKKESVLLSLLKNYFSYGFRIESIRDILRLRNFAEEDGIVLPEDDEELKSQILACGVLIDGKVHIKSNNMTQDLDEIIQNAFASGAQVIYYEALFNNSSEWMAENFITSEEMLKDYLKQNLSQYVYSKVFLMNSPKKTEKEIVTEEIIRVWGDSQLCAVDTLAEKLPFIPNGNVWRVISGNRHFVLLSEGVYLRVDRLVITDQEKERIRNFVDKDCSEKGFASLSDVPLGDIPEQNYELSEVAIHNAIYNLLLAEEYQRRDKILTRDGTALDTVSLLKEQIAGKEACSFTEIANEVVRLTGGTNRQYAFEALYSSMVRTDLDKFVADKFVSFNAEEIDTILSGMIPDHFCAIKDITTFAMFPICGMPWNHYLLESYCYKYSKKYTINVKNFNDRNAGIIVEKGYNKTYIEMLAIAVAKSDIILEPETIGIYLNKVGYLAKSKYGNLDEIAEMAKKIREG